MKIGDKIIIFSDLADLATMREYIVTKINKDTVQCGSSENIFYIGFVWPERVKEELLSIVNKRQQLRKQYDDSMSLIYELKNAIVRGEK